MWGCVGMCGGVWGVYWSRLLRPFCKHGPLFTALSSRGMRKEALAPVVVVAVAALFPLVNLVKCGTSFWGGHVGFEKLEGFVFGCN